MKKIKLKLANIKNKIGIIGTSLAVLLVSRTTVFAADNTYAKNASDWLLNGIQVITLAVVAFICFKEITKRKFVQLIITIVISAIILSIVYNPSELTTVGDYLFKTVFG